jgi:predicted amidophosphoribosyltransferase
MILDQFGTALLEAHCFLCAEPTNAASLICEPCWCDLVVEELTCKRCGCRVTVEGVCAKCLKNAGDIDSTTTLVSYQFPASKLLLSLKYQGQLVLAREFGRRISEKICAQNETLPECIVPVPLHPARLIGRGYNQALEISRVISKRLCGPLR